MKKFRRTKAVGQASAVALVIAALVLAVAFILTSPTKTPKFVLTAGTGFAITSTISSSSTSQTAGLLYPGAQSYLWYTAHNPLKVPITVTSMSIATVTPPAGCAASNLNYSSTTFSGSLVVPALGTSAVSVPISLVDTSTNQDSCEGATFNFVYAGTATYTEVYATTTAVTSSLNPSGVGQAVTYTATVTASATASQDPVPSSPTGTVAFKDGTTAICTATLTSTGTTTSTATCGPITYGSIGTHAITATYTNSDGNFTNSSGSVSETVRAGNCESTIPTSGATVTTISGTYSGNYEVKDGTVLYLDGGTITGNLSVDATGQFTASGGTVKGNITSSGGPVSLQATTVGGNVQTSAGLALGANTKVSGNVTVTGGTTLCISGNGSGPVTISGNLQVESLGTTTVPVSICNTKLGGNLTYENNAAPVIIGGSAACSGNTVSGNLQVENNTAQVTIGGAGTGYGNTASGNIQVSGNKGGGTLTNNSASGNCRLSGDTPGIVGSLNTTHGSNTCNGTA